MGGGLASGCCSDWEGSAAVVAMTRADSSSVVLGAVAAEGAGVCIAFPDMAASNLGWRRAISCFVGGAGEGAETVCSTGWEEVVLTRRSERR